MGHHSGTAGVSPQDPGVAPPSVEAHLPSGGWKEREPGAFVKDSRVIRVLAKKQKLSTELSVVVLEQSDDGPMPSP